MLVTVRNMFDVNGAQHGLLFEGYKNSAGRRFSPTGECVYFSFGLENS